MAANVVYCAADYIYCTLRGVDGLAQSAVRKLGRTVRFEGVLRGLVMVILPRSERRHNDEKWC